MKHTDRQPQERTFADLLRAVARRQPVTITYRKVGCPDTHVRTIEPTDVWVSGSGHVLLAGLDRSRDGERRTFRVDHVLAYTVHRGGRFVLDHPEPTPAVNLAEQVADVDQAVWTLDLYALASSQVDAADAAEARGLVRLAELHTEVADALEWAADLLR